MTSVEKSGRTVEEAVNEALQDLGAERDAVNIEVIEEGTKGLFGFLGTRLAKVRVSLKASPADATVEQPIAETVDESEALTQRAAEEDATDVEAERQEAIQKATEFLHGILTRLGLNVGVESREGDEGIVHLNISGEGVGLVIGRHGQTLDAIQYLTNVVANRNGASSRVRIVIDAEGYRVRRAETLTNMAERMAERVVSQGRKAVLEPMSALERRVVHLALQSSDSVETYSEGEDPYRRVVIVPKQ